MHNNSDAEILCLHQKHGIQLQHSVWLLCKRKGIVLSGLAEECGYHRNYLYMSLTGAIKPAAKFREAVAQKLGIDPWLYATEANSSDAKYSN